MIRYFVVWWALSCQPCAANTQDKPCYEPVQERRVEAFYDWEQAMRFQMNKIMDGEKTELYEVTKAP
jgi:hypothetical protein